MLRPWNRPGPHRRWGALSAYKRFSPGKTLAVGRLCRPEQSKKSGSPQNIDFAGLFHGHHHRRPGGVRTVFRRTFGGPRKRPAAFLLRPWNRPGPHRRWGALSAYKRFSPGKTLAVGRLCRPEQSKKSGSPQNIDFAGLFHGHHHRRPGGVRDGFPRNLRRASQEARCFFCRGHGIDRGPIKEDGLCLTVRLLSAVFQNFFHWCTKFGTYPGLSRI